MSIAQTKTASRIFSLGKVDPSEILFCMGGFGVLLFVPAYSLLQKGIIDYKSLLLFEGIFFANPHLVSTYLQAYSGKAEINRHKIYTIIYPIALLIGISCFIYFFGLNFLWVLGSIYFYWQWWHHARQSFGLGRKYQKANIEAELSNQLNSFDYKFNDIALWTIAIIGILLKSNAAGDYYEGIPIRVLHLPMIPVVTLLTIAIAIVLAYFVRQAYIFRTTGIIQTSFLTHWFIQSVVFICFFGLLPTDIGIIAASFWHCTQYISFVKGHQEAKVEKSVLKSFFWQNLTSKENWYLYLSLLLTLSLVLPLIRVGLSSLQITALILGFSMAITFHHYILDAVLWTQKEVKWSLNRE